MIDFAKALELRGLQDIPTFAGLRICGSGALGL